MGNKNKIIFWSVILAIGTGLIVWSSYGWNKRAPVAQNQQFSPSSSPFAIPTPSKSPRQLTPAEIEELAIGDLSPTTVPYSQLTKPATCQVAGEIKFLSPMLSQNTGAYFSYTGLDSPARQIKWKISPTDNMRVGPNIAAPLKLPDGQSQIIVSLPQAPNSKSYILTSSMTYGRFVDGVVKIYEVNCEGSVKVELAY